MPVEDVLEAFQAQAVDLDIAVEAFFAHQAVAHVAADEVGPSARLADVVHDPANAFFHVQGHGFHLVRLLELQRAELACQAQAA